MPDQTLSPELADAIADAAKWRRYAEQFQAAMLAMAYELAAARSEIAALRNDLDAKISDFDAAMMQLANSRRIAELEAQPNGGAR